jgi:hypothetical protein
MLGKLQDAQDGGVSWAGMWRTVAQLADRRP